MGWQKLSNNQ